MINYYVFGYYSHEESGEITLTHERVFTKEEIENFAFNAYIYAAEFHAKFEMTFQRLFIGPYQEEISGNKSFFVEYLKINGFKGLTITQESFVDGWANADELDDFDEDTGDLEKRIQSVLSKTASESQKNEKH